MEGIMYGYCHCGCGQKTNIALQTDRRRGHIKGEPMRFIHGHANTNWFETGKNNPNWKSGRKTLKQKYTSYILIFKPGHPRSQHDGYALEHVLVVEKDWGYPLPAGSVVHHIDGNGLNNRLPNLMVFKNQSEHLRFHRLQKRLTNNFKSI